MGTDAIFGLVLVLLVVAVIALIALLVFMRKRAGAALEGVTISVNKSADEVWGIIRKQFLPIFWADQGTSFRRRARQGNGYILSVDVNSENNRTIVKLWVSDGSWTGAASGYSKIKKICNKLQDN